MLCFIGQDGDDAVVERSIVASPAERDVLVRNGAATVPFRESILLPDSRSGVANVHPFDLDPLLLGAYDGGPGRRRRVFPPLDCDDDDPAVNPDQSCDGVDEDTDDAIFPGAPEVCDGVDRDCDGLPDDTLYKPVDVGLACANGPVDALFPALLSLLLTRRRSPPAPDLR